MDDVSPQPKPRTAARAPKRVAPADPRTDDRPRRRTPARTGNTTGGIDRPVLPSSSVIADPLLQPVHPAHDGTPVEIPIIVPAKFDDDDGLDTATSPQRTTAEPDGGTARADVWSDEPTLVTTAAATSSVTGVVVVPVDDFTSDLPRPPEFVEPDGTDGLPSMYRSTKPERALRPVKLPKAPRPRVRRVTRVVRQIDTWSVFKVALGFSLFLYLVCLTAGVLLWQVAQNTGTVDNVERFFESFGWQTFQLNGGAIFHNAWVGGLFLVVGLTGLGVLAATMFNLIAELVGGVRVTVLEEEVVAREDRGLGWRRGSRHVEVPPPAAASGDPSDTLG